MGCLVPLRESEDAAVVIEMFVAAVVDDHDDPHAYAQHDQAMRFLKEFFGLHGRDYQLLRQVRLGQPEFWEKFGIVRDVFDECEDDAKPKKLLQELVEFMLGRREQERVVEMCRIWNVNHEAREATVGLLHQSAVATIENACLGVEGSEVRLERLNELSQPQYWLHNRVAEEWDKAMAGDKEDFLNVQTKMFYARYCLAKGLDMSWWGPMVCKDVVYTLLTVHRFHRERMGPWSVFDALIMRHIASAMLDTADDPAWTIPLCECAMDSVASKVSENEDFYADLLSEFNGDKFMFTGERRIMCCSKFEEMRLSLVCGRQDEDYVLTQLEERWEKIQELRNFVEREKERQERILFSDVQPNEMIWMWDHLCRRYCKSLNALLDEGVDQCKHFLQTKANKLRERYDVFVNSGITELFRTRVHSYLFHRQHSYVITDELRRLFSGYHQYVVTRIVAMAPLSLRHFRAYADAFQRNLHPYEEQLSRDKVLSLHVKMQLDAWFYSFLPSFSEEALQNALAGDDEPDTGEGDPSDEDYPSSVEGEESEDSDPPLVDSSSDSDEFD